MNILFIGNSYTFDNSLARMFESLANENGKGVTALSICPGGRELLDYAKDDEATLELKGLLDKNHFDVCFIQEESTMPMKAYDRFESGLKVVLSFISGRADKVILFNTWGRGVGCPELEGLGWTNESMTKGLYEGYSRAARDFDLGISTVGLNFFEVHTAHNEINLYNTDLAHPSYKGSALACLTHYFTLFGAFPENTATLDIEASELEIFRSVISK